MQLDLSDHQTLVRAKELIDLPQVTAMRYPVTHLLNQWMDTEPSEHLKGVSDGYLILVFEPCNPHPTRFKGQPGALTRPAHTQHTVALDAQVALLYRHDLKGRVPGHWASHQKFAFDFDCHATYLDGLNGMLALCAGCWVAYTRPPSSLWARLVLATCCTRAFNPTCLGCARPSGLYRQKGTNSMTLSDPIAWLLVVLSCFAAALVIASRIRQWSRERALHRQHGGLRLIRALFVCLRALQQHRGVTSAVIAGDASFAARRPSLVAEIDDLMAVGRDAVSAESWAVDPSTWDSIVTNWHRLRDQPMESDPLANFQQHTQIIQRVLGLIATVGDTCGLTRSTNMYQRSYNRQVLLQLPAMIEHIGQVRALTLCAIPTGRCDRPLALRLRYLLRCIANEQQQLHGLLERHSGNARRIAELEALIQREVLDAAAIHVSTDQLFAVVTRLIDSLLDAVASGMNQIETELERQQVQRA